MSSIKCIKNFYLKNIFFSQLLWGLPEVEGLGFYGAYCICENGGKYLVGSLLGDENFEENSDPCSDFACHGGVLEDECLEYAGLWSKKNSHLWCQWRYFL